KGSGVMPGVTVATLVMDPSREAPSTVPMLKLTSSPADTVPTYEQITVSLPSTVGAPAAQVTPLPGVTELSKETPNGKVSTTVIGLVTVPIESAGPAFV